MSDYKDSENELEQTLERMRNLDKFENHKTHGKRLGPDVKVTARLLRIIADHIERGALDKYQFSVTNKTEKSVNFVIESNVDGKIEISLMEREGVTVEHISDGSAVIVNPGDRVTVNIKTK